MKRSLTRAALGPNRLRLAGQVITCVIGVNAVSALSQHFNQIAADAIADCIGGQILQSMPVFARMSSGGLDPSSIATQIALAFIGSTLLTIFPIILSKLRARPHSRFLCLALPLCKSGAEYPRRTSNEQHRVLKADRNSPDLRMGSLR
jgi:hypothetical protein